MTTRSSQHDTFRLERHYPAAPSRVFQAFADPAAKDRWFGSPDGTTRQKGKSFDFREGGRETAVTVFADGTEYGYFATYTDIVPGERLVYTYEMTMNGARISVSVATVEFAAAPGGGTDFAITEQGVYLDGLDDVTKRRGGTEYLLEALAKTLTE
ncbi:SRPBCC family protein [Actinoplanes bogorensis]|uniref:SRPBCC family protein n=1 Tax=Paractinoplanes bogorensis TaxID=1610840 RepID=A0ABS5Z4K6_9ACTN|nr:SRPBCC family protein [Actinoplanes bogorensis]MBU2670619.1 SRPBCC family protein [Actinoplanes bogorensis]